MREIKFRARWRADGEIVEDINDRPISDLNAKHLIIEKFTGMIDENGSEIYEGDIVMKTVSVLCDPANRWGGTKWVERAFEVFYHNQGFTPSDLHECEVIGNIHKDINLLEANR